MIGDERSSKVDVPDVRPIPDKAFLGRPTPRRASRPRNSLGQPERSAGPERIGGRRELVVFTSSGIAGRISRLRADLIGERRYQPMRHEGCEWEHLNARARKASKRETPKGSRASGQFCMVDVALAGQNSTKGSLTCIEINRRVER